MTTEEICAKVNGTLAVPAEGAAATGVYVGDLLSDVMGHAGEGCVLVTIHMGHAGEDCALVTIQNHLNTIAVCTLVGCAVIVLCHNRPVPPDMAEAAAREGVAIIITPLSQYATARALSALPPAEH